MMTNTELRNDLQHQIDCAYDCDQPQLVADLKAKLRMLPAVIENDSKSGIYEDYMTDGQIDTGKLFGGF